ncbi:MAG: hypothetical protein HKN25_11025 [Pyrinomonadaceae bacterium]|nr:hypothetical protein [Pyrinomonadaceae bacterium]
MKNLVERIERLNANQKALLVKRIGADSLLKTAEKKNDVLVAYYTTENDSLTKEEIVESLKDKLPDYMIPAQFVRLPEFPKLTNGKIDTQSLRVPRVAKSTAAKKSLPIVSENEIEIKLTKIWEDVLSIKPIQSDDNFFEIGGDSILSIRIVAKARNEGILLAPNQLFENQTISELAQNLKLETVQEEEEKAYGNVPLLPIQHWFFEEHRNAPHHWNQAVLFNSNRALDTEVLQKSVEQLVDHHEALRLNFSSYGETQIASISERESGVAIESFDFTGVEPKEINKSVRSKSIEMQSNLDLAKSNLFKLAYFDCGDNGARLLIFAHHLIVDNVSFRILFEDLEKFYRQIVSGEEVSLPRKTVSYKKWGEHLLEKSGSNQIVEELDFWKLQTVDSGDFPTDKERDLPYLVESAEVIKSVIDTETTVELLRNSNRAYNTKSEELLIAAFSAALQKWKGVQNYCLGLENHGRGGQVDLSSTVGWFTTFFPIVLDIKDSQDVKSNIVYIKETLRNVPNRGLNYGILRYMKKEIGLKQNPAVLFNYMGERSSFDSEVFGSGDFINEGAYAPDTERYNLIGINAFHKDGQLESYFDFSRDLYDQETINNLVGHFEEEIQRIVEHCSFQEKTEYTPSDFSEADLDQKDLDNLLSQIS